MGFPRKEEDEDENRGRDDRPRRDKYIREPEIHGSCNREICGFKGRLERSHSGNAQCPKCSTLSVTVIKDADQTGGYQVSDSGR